MQNKLSRALNKYDVRFDCSCHSQLEQPLPSDYPGIQPLPHLTLFFHFLAPALFAFHLHISPIFLSASTCLAQVSLCTSRVKSPSSCYISLCIYLRLPPHAPPIHLSTPTSCSSTRRASLQVQLHMMPTPSSPSGLSPASLRSRVQWAEWGPSRAALARLSLIRAAAASMSVMLSTHRTMKCLQQCVEQWSARHSFVW